MMQRRIFKTLPFVLGAMAMASLSAPLLCPARADVVATYPGDYYIYNVKATTYGAKGDGVTDDTAAIQKAIDAILYLRGVRPGGTNLSVSEARHPHATLYFPNGTYRVTGRLTFGAETFTGTNSTSGYQRWVHVKGQSRDNTVLRLDNGLSPTSNPFTVFSFNDSDGNNDAFGNTIEDITINTGSNNPGAAALLFHNNNYGYVRRVLLKSGDGQGRSGLQLGTNLAGIGLVKNLEVQGFNYGIINSGGAKITYALEYITLSGQKIAGILTRDKGLSIRRLTSTNSVPALRQLSSRPAGSRDNGQVVIVGSTLQGGSATQPAIDNVDGWIMARGLTVSSYGNTLRDHGTNHNFGSEEEYVRGGVQKLWSDTPGESLNLPIKDTPEPAADPQSDWAVVDTNTQDDDTTAIQNAINSGKPTVFLKRGSYTISRTLVLGNATLGGTTYTGGSVGRFNGNWSTIAPTPAFAASGDPLFRFTNGSANTVVVEAFNHLHFAGSGADNTRMELFMQNDASRTLVMRDLELKARAGYRATGSGDVFIEDVFTSYGGEPDQMVNVPGWKFTGQNVWARSFNHEASWPHIYNSGGDVWILGFKLGEGHGPYIINNGGGRIEALGGIFNNLAGDLAYPPNRAVVEVSNAQVSISGMATSGSSVHPVAKETRGSETRTLAWSNPSVPKRQEYEGFVLTLLRSGKLPNKAPSVTLTSPVSGTVVPSTVQVSATASDSDGTIARVEFYVDGSSTPFATVTSAPYETTWNAPTGSHTISAKSFDNDGAVSAPSSVTVTTNVAPTVTLTAPTSGTRVLGAPATFSVTANAADSDGAVSRVDFFADGSTTRFASDTSAPYAATWSNVSAGTHIVSAKSFDNLGAVSSASSASVSVKARISAMNAGGPAAGVFAADAPTAFSASTIYAAATPPAVSLVGVTDAAPLAVYQSERYGTGDFTYTKTGLTPNASHLVRLHFAETLSGIVTGSRVFNISVTGAPVLNNFDIYAAAGGANKAIVREFAAVSNAAGTIVVTFGKSSSQNPKVNGIEILR